MKVQTTSQGRGYIKTYFLIPKELEEDLHIKDGQHLYLTFGASRHMFLSLKRRYSGDVRVTATEWITKHTTDSKYTSMRIVIPKMLVDILEIKKGMDLKMERSGNSGMSIQF